MLFNIPSGQAAGMEFAGNENAKKQLSYYMDGGGRLPHALIFEGAGGSGRRTLAHILAMAICCRSDRLSMRPCGQCSSCVKAASGNHPDIEQAGGDGSAKSFHIDVVRALREDAYIMPNESDFRVLILSQVQGMTDQAQNALLKLMEEPPRHLILLLTCENRARMLDTIQSRANIITLAPVEQAEALPIVKAHCPDAGQQEIIQALGIFGGIIGQTINGLNGTDEISKVAGLAPQIAAAIAAPLELELLKLCAQLEKDKQLTDDVLRALTLILRDALAIQADPHFPALSISRESAAALSKAIKPEHLMALISEVGQLQKARLRNANQGLLTTLMSSRLRAAAGR